MAKTYLKRIQSTETPQGEPLNVYVSVRDSTPNLYYITHRRRHIFTSQRKEAALTRLAQLQREGVTIDSPPDEVAEADAQRLETSDRPWEKLRFHVLVWLAARSLQRKQRSHQHIVDLKVLLNLPNEWVPSGHDEAVNWIRRILETVTETTTAQSTFRKRLVYLNMALKEISHNPVACKKWLHLPALAAPLIRHQGQELAGKAPVQNRPCMTKAEITDCLNQCESIESAFLVLKYLSLGCRSAKAENLTLANATADWRIDIDTVESKTKVGRRPPCPLALKALLLFCERQPVGEVPNCVDRDRFRPTTATMLSLAGVPILEISERLGHGTAAMVLNHYATAKPIDMAPGQTLEQYLGIGPLIVGGFRVEENAWDRWVLKTALEQAQRFGVIEEFKKHVVVCLGGTVGELPEVAEF